MRTSQGIEKQGLDKLQQNLHSIYRVGKNVEKKAPAAQAEAKQAEAKQAEAKQAEAKQAEAAQKQPHKEVEAVNVKPIEEEVEDHESNGSSPLQNKVPEGQLLASPLSSNSPEPSPTGTALVTVKYKDGTELNFDVTYNKGTGDVMGAGFPHGENSFSSNDNTGWSPDKIQDYATVLQSFGARGAKLNENHPAFKNGISPENALGLQKAFNQAGNCKKGTKEIFENITIQDDSGKTYGFNKNGELVDAKGNRYDSPSNPIVGRVVKDNPEISKSIAPAPAPTSDQSHEANTGAASEIDGRVDGDNPEMSTSTVPAPAPTSHQSSEDQSVEDQGVNTGAAPEVEDRKSWKEEGPSHAEWLDATTGKEQSDQMRQSLAPAPGN